MDTWIETGLVRSIRLFESSVLPEQAVVRCPALTSCSEGLAEGKMGISELLMSAGI